MRKAVTGEFEGNISTDANSAISVGSCAVDRVKHRVMIWREPGNVLTSRSLSILEGKTCNNWPIFYLRIKNFIKLCRLHTTNK